MATSSASMSKPSWRIADLRRKLMVSTIQATQAREGIETTEDQADRAYYIVTEAERTAFFDL